MNLQAETEQRPPSILVADDDPHIVELVAFRLERAGYDVVCATDGREALRVLLEEVPDLAVLDVMMPVLDGYE
jgi:two-component system, OmpR family, response regulator